jgi:hypothetical protein
MLELFSQGNTGFREFYQGVIDIGGVAVSKDKTRTQIATWQ